MIVQDHGAAATTGDRYFRQLGTIIRRRYFLNSEACANGDILNDARLVNFRRILFFNGLVFQRVAANVGEADLKMVRSLQGIAAFGLLLYNGQAAGFDRVDKHDLQLGLAFCIRSVGVRVRAENDGIIVFVFLAGFDAVVGIIIRGNLRGVAFGIFYFDTAIVGGSARPIFKA